MIRLRHLLAGLVALGAAACATSRGPGSSDAALPPGAQLVGVATVDITPEEPIRLAGYANRSAAVDAVARPLRAKALAIGGGAAGPVVLVTLDLIGVPGWVTEEVARRLAPAGVARARLAITATHTHAAPELTGVLPTHLTEPRTAEAEAVIRRYTDRLVDRIEEVALAALADRRPARIAWSQGRAGFAANRRVLRDGRWAAWGIQPDGVVDHDLPVLRVTDLEGGLRAVLLGYACHATTHSGDAIHGDWPGAAQDSIEARHPGATALVVIGAGADANPDPRGSAAAVDRHAHELAAEVDRLLAGPMTPLDELPTARLREITLDFDSVPSRAQLEATVRAGGRPGITAGHLVARMDRGEDIGRAAYPVQTWSFGDGLAMVFLAGEVTADYGLRLKRELGPGRVWVNAYANGSPFYVASERMIAEGGYEVNESMLSYGHPSRLARGTEDRIVGAVHSLLRGTEPGASSPAAPRSRPNIVLIMADDLGYGELGSYGQQRIRTPHLDALAAGGMRFTSFYSGSPVCAPSRAALLTGLHTGHGYVRDNYELGGFLDHEERGQLALKPGTPTLAGMLREAGYATAAIGKWGLGGPGSTGEPGRHGFDLFYGYLDQKQAHNFYPTHLWRGGETLRWDTLANEYFHPHQALAGDPSDPASYAPYRGRDYSPDLTTEEALRFIREHREEPFFLYLPYTLPHLALQVPEEELTAYEFEETPYLGKADAAANSPSYLPHPRPRAAYAGMISRLDRYVGQVRATLRELGLEENTLVIFTSDNGPTYTGGVDFEFFRSAGPLRGLKGSVYEGGIRVPMIAAWPGRIAPGTVSDRPAALWDVLPTLAEVAGATPPAGVDGVSLLPFLLGEPSRPARREGLYWEIFDLCGGQQALRVGRWKAVRLRIRADSTAPLELYDLEADPAESRNAAAEHPEVVAAMWERMRAARVPSEIAEWNFTVATSPRAVATTPTHDCFPWEKS